MASGEKLDRVERSGATVLGLPLRVHRGREEGEGNSFPSFAWPGKGSCTKVRGGAIADPPEHAVTALRRTKTRGEKCGRERGRWRAHQGGRRGRGRPKSTGTPSSGSRWPQRDCCELQHEDSDGESANGGEERGFGSQTTQKGGRGAGRNRGSGRSSAVAESGEREGAPAVKEDVKRAWPVSG